MTFDSTDTDDSHLDDTAAGDAPGPLGPAMQELSPLQRRFVWALFETPPGPGCFTRAAKRAGYGKNSNHKTLVQMAHMLWRNEKIRRAYQETGHKYIGHAAVAALKAVHELVLKPSHPDHLKACRIFIDRGWPAESLQRIDVSHTHKTDNREAMDLAVRFAAELGVPVEKLIGASRPVPADMKLIEGSATEVKSDPHQNQAK